MKHKNVHLAFERSKRLMEDEFRECVPPKLPVYATQFEIMNFNDFRKIHQSVGFNPTPAKKETSMVYLPETGTVVVVDSDLSPLADRTIESLTFDFCHEHAHAVQYNLNQEYNENLFPEFSRKGGTLAERGMVVSAFLEGHAHRMAFFACWKTDKPLRAHALFWHKELLLRYEELVASQAGAFSNLPLPECFSVSERAMLSLNESRGEILRDEPYPFGYNFCFMNCEFDLVSMLASPPATYRELLISDEYGRRILSEQPLRWYLV